MTTRASAPAPYGPLAVAQAAAGQGLTGDALVTAVAIAGAETGGTWSPTSHNPIPPDDSYGYWQINMLGPLGPPRRAALGLSRNTQLYDPNTNARAMMMVSDHGTNWQPWSTYTSGSYGRYLSVARQAVAQLGGAAGNQHTTTVPGSVHKVFPTLTNAQWRSFTTAKQLQLIQQAAQQEAAQAGIANDKANQGLYGAAVAAGGEIKGATLGLGSFLALLAQASTWRRVLYVIGGLVAVVLAAFLLDRSLLNQVAGTAVTNAAGAIARAAV